MPFRLSDILAQCLKRPDFAEWHKTLLLAIPLFLSNATVPLIGIVDTAVVGHLDSPVSLAAVALGSSVYSALFWAFSFLRTSTTGLASQAFGAGDPERVQAILYRALALALALSLLCMGMFVVGYDIALIAFNPEDDVADALWTYLAIRMLGAPASLLAMVFLGWFVAIDHAGDRLRILLPMTAINIVLDLVFVFGFGWDVAGVATASLVAEYAGLIIAFFLMRRRVRRFPPINRSLSQILEWSKIRPLLMLNRDLFGRALLMQVAFVTFTALSSRLGTTAIAANAILFNLFVLASHGLDGLADAQEARTGWAIGENSARQFLASFAAATQLSFSFALVVTILYVLFGDALMAMMTSIDAVLAFAGDHLIYPIILPLTGVAAFLLDGTFFGATRGREMLIAMIISVVLFIITMLTCVHYLGNHGLWIALNLFMIYRAAALLYYLPGIPNSLARH